MDLLNSIFNPIVNLFDGPVLAAAFSLGAYFFNKFFGKKVEKAAEHVNQVDSYVNKIAKVTSKIALSLQEESDGGKKLTSDEMKEIFVLLTQVGDKTTDDH